MRPDVLVPGRRQPIGSQPGRHGAADDEPEEPRPAHGHEAGFNVPGELVDDRLCIGAALRERPVERASQVVDGDVRGGSDATRSGRRPIRDRESGGAPEQVGRPGVWVIGGRLRGLRIGRDLALLRPSLRVFARRLRNLHRQVCQNPWKSTPSTVRYRGCSVSQAAPASRSWVGRVRVVGTADVIDALGAWQKCPFRRTRSPGQHRGGSFGGRLELFVDRRRRSPS